MAKQNSFDIVSKIDLAEVKNAVQQALKEVAQRYDLKGSNSDIELDEGENRMVLSSADEFQLQAVDQILRLKLVKRKVPLKALDPGKIEPAAGDSVRQVVSLQQGIPTEKAREIVKYVKNLKLKKVQVAIQGDELRVTGRDRDALQEVITALKDHDFGIDMQFVNYR